MPPLTATLPSKTAVPFVSGLRSHGERPALITAEGVVTYGALADRVDAMVGVLGTARRLVMITGGNSVEPLVTYLAALAAGHPVLLAPGDNADHVNSLVEAYDPDVVCIGGGREWRLDERHPVSVHELHPDLALLLTTSGSTGSPKLVRLSHANLQANAEAIATYLGIRDTDRAVTTLPLHYCYGLSVIHSHLLRGAGLILTDLSVVDACFWDLFRDSGGTTFAGVPYTFDLLDRVGFERMRLPHLRYVTQAGGRLDPDRVRRYAAMGERHGWELFVMYGQTEATARMAYLPPSLAQAHPGAVGIPIPGGTFTLEPVDGFDGPDEGELVYTGANVMLGYADDPSDLALGRTVDVLRTGDIARRTDDGLYEVVARRNRLVKIFGLRIDLQRVEAVLERNGVHSCCVGEDGELVVAVEQDYPEQMVQRLAAEHFGLPPSVVRVCFLMELPRLATGKPDYRAVARLASSAEHVVATSTPVTTSDQTVDSAALRALFAELLDRTDVTDDSTFVSLEGDSLSYVEVSLRLEEKLGHLPADWHTTRIGDLAPVRARRWRGWQRLETNVVLRALAIVLIVGSHANLFTVLGGAHVLLGVAGFNFARFQLTAADRRDRLRHITTSVARIAVPSMVWIALVVALTGTYGPLNVFLLNGLFGPAQWTEPAWHFWFIEALVYILVVVAAVVAVLDPVERRWPLAFALAMVGVGLLARYDVFTLGAGLDRYHSAHVIFWLFALGWATAKSTTTWHRIVVSAVVVLGVPGFFEDPRREAVVGVGMLLLVWLSGIRLPKMVSRLVGVLAGASLYIYLTHWQFYPHLENSYPMAATLLSLLLGVVAWLVGTRAMNRLESAVRRVRRPRRVPIT